MDWRKVYTRVFEELVERGVDVSVGVESLDWQEKYGCNYLEPFKYVIPRPRIQPRQSDWGWDRGEESR